MNDQVLGRVDYGTLGGGNSYAVYTDTYDPSLLNPMPRAELRKRFGIRGDEFVGYDVWHCHESTFLLNNGAPVAGTLKFLYPSSSPNMVESKSMKLYLNSFDMCKMGDTLEDARNNYTQQVIDDLSNIVEAEVQAHFFDSVDWAFITSPWRKRLSDIDIDCVNIAEILDLSSVEPFDDYQSMESYVRLTTQDATLGVSGRYYTNALRSRCRHTKQKDTGAAYVWHDNRFKDSMVIDPLSFMRQVVALREVNEFHELCAEKLFLECLRVVPRGDELSIILLYSRRGSLDINPVRTTDISQIPSEFIDVTQLTAKAQGQ